MAHALIHTFSGKKGRNIGFTIAFVGALLMSIDPLFIRFSGISGFDTAFLFGLFTAISMPTILHYTDKRGVLNAVRQSGWPLLGAGILMLGSSSGLVFSIKNTTISNTFIILAATPAIAAVFSWVILKEPTNRSTWKAIIGVMLGISIIAYGSLNGDLSVMGNWLGDSLALFSVICLALMFTLLRKYPDISHLACVGFGGLLLALVMFFFATPSEYTSNTWLIMAAMGLFTAPMGRVLSMAATRYITAAEVSMTLMLETVLATVWGLLFFNEIPAFASLIGGLIILITLIIYTCTSIREG